MSTESNHTLRIAAFAIVGVVIGVVATLLVTLGLLGREFQFPQLGLGSNSDSVSGSELRGAQAGSELSGTVEREKDLGQLAFLVDTPSAFSRSEQLYRLLRSAGTNKLVDLLVISENIGAQHLRHATQRAIVQRLTDIDPRNALSALENLPNQRHNALISTVFEEWSNTAVDEAVAHAKTLDDAQKPFALQGILGSQDNQSREFQEQLAQQLEADIYVARLGTQSANDASISDPKAEWQALTTDNLPDTAQTAQLIRVAQDWVDQAGLGAISQIDSSLTDSNLKNAVIGSVIHRAMLAGTESALEQVLELEGDIRELALQTIAKAWASIGPQAALNSIAEIDSNRVRRQMLEHFVTAWANYDPSGMMQDFDLVPANLRTLAEENAIRKLAKTKPQEAASLLANLSNEDLRFGLTLELAEHWSDQDVDNALAWAQKEQFENTFLQYEVLGTVLRKLARDQPDLALQMAADVSSDEFFIGLEATVIQEVAQVDLEKAVSLLPQVPDGMTKATAFTSVGRALVRDDQADRAIEFAQQLPEDVRDLYYNQIVNEWAYTNPESLVSMLDKLPTIDSKYVAAMDLVRASVGTGVLTKDQVEYVKGFLPDDYNAETGARSRESGSTVLGVLFDPPDVNMSQEEKEELVQKMRRELMRSGNFYRVPATR